MMSLLPSEGYLASGSCLFVGVKLFVNQDSYTSPNKIPITLFSKVGEGFFSHAE